MMDKDLEDNYSENHTPGFVPLDFAQQTEILRLQQQQQQQEYRHQEGSDNSVEMVDYMLSNHPPPQHQLSLDKLSFADVMQFADFGPKLALNQSKALSSEDDSYLFKFNFMNDKQIQDGPSNMVPSFPPASLPPHGQPHGFEDGEDDGGQFSENASSVQQLGFGSGGGGSGVGDEGKKVSGGVEVKNRRKRPRTLKTNEEVESQRMTHIAVERNRRRQMNDHLRVLRSLMPGSYVQRGDQASIIGGAIEFVRELEQLLQCLESQKRRRIYGGSEPPRNMADTASLPIQHSPQQPFFPPLSLPCGNDGMRMLDLDPDTGDLHEDVAENKSCLADIEVRVLGYDAMIKILSRRRPGQLIKIIAALEDVQFDILHTNITTIEQTVLYSFNVKIAGEARCTAEDIANSVHQIISFIDTSTI